METDIFEYPGQNVHRTHPKVDLKTSIHFRPLPLWRYSWTGASVSLGVSGTWWWTSSFEGNCGVNEEHRLDFLSAWSFVKTSPCVVVVDQTGRGRFIVWMLPVHAQWYFYSRYLCFLAVSCTSWSNVAPEESILNLIHLAIFANFYNSKLSSEFS